MTYALELKESEYTHNHFSLEGRHLSLLVGIWNDDEVVEIQDGIEDAICEAFNQSLLDSIVRLIANESIRFPAHRWNDDDDEYEDYEAIVPFADFIVSVSSNDNEYDGGFQFSIELEDDGENEDLANENSIEPPILLAFWRLQELITQDIIYEAYDAAWHAALEFCVFGENQLCGAA